MLMTEIDFYTCRLTDGDIFHLVWYASRIASKSPEYGQWLIGVGDNEMARRESLETDEPQGPIRPDAEPFTRWSNATLAKALKASHMLASACESYELGQLFDWAHCFLVGVASRRLEAR